MLNIRGKTSVPLRVMNPFDEAKTLYPDTVVGTVEGYGDIVDVIKPFYSDLGNLRRSNELSPEKCSSRACDVADHLRELFSVLK